MRRDREGAERFAERRRRENEAPRLAVIAPSLETLKFKVEERRAGSTLAETTHVRTIMVATAPALFFFPCQDAACRDGGHDVTTRVCADLRDRRTEFSVEDQCPGQIGSAECRRVIKLQATATYKS